MTTVELLQQTRRLGFRLEPRPGGRLAVQPASKLSAALAAELRHYKTEIITLLTEMEAARTKVPVGTAVPVVPGTVVPTLAPVAPVAVMPPVALCKEWGSVPPDDLPLVTIKPTPTPDQRDLIVAYIIRQCSDNVIHAWVMQRIACYVEKFSQTWSEDLPTYAAARDAACWQLNRTETAVWLLLEGIEACLKD
jgi:hypothetical protein